jgi:hypothetical protein
MTTFNRFAQGSGVFICHSCGKSTRDVNGVNGQLQLCERCELAAYVENAESDYGIDSPEAAQYRNDLKAHDEKNLKKSVAPVGQPEEVKSIDQVQPRTQESKMSKKSRALTKAQKTLNLVAKMDGKIKPGDLVARIQSMCKFETERAARTYLHNARKALKAGKKPTASRKRKAKASEAA